MATAQEISDYVDGLKASGVSPEAMGTFLANADSISGYVGAIQAAGLTVQDFGGFLLIAKLQIELRGIEAMQSNLEDKRIATNDEYNAIAEQLEAARQDKVDQINTLQAAAAAGRAAQG